MKIVFWLVISFLTLVVWGGCLWWPWYKNPAVRLGYGAKAALFAFPLLVLGVYLWEGGGRQLQQYWAWQKQEREVQQEMAALKSPQELITRLQDHLQQHPESAEGWYLLGKLYLSEQQYAEAEKTLAKAHQLQPKSAETVAALAKADFFNHGGHLTPAMAEMLNSVLESLAQPVDALNLLAVDAYRQKNFHQAVAYWQRALAIVPSASPDSRTLIDMIAQAERQE